MEGLIKLILKNVIPNYKASNNNSMPVRVISEDSENIESYATLVKKKILEDVDKKSTKDIIETFKEFNRIELYDSELFSYKAVLLMSDGMLEDAELELNEGLRRYPNDIRLLSNLCRLFSLTQNFNKSLEIFCRVKMLSRGKCELELNQLIPHEYYDVNICKLKVLHGTMYPDNTINKVAAELSKKGIYAKTLSYCPKYTGYSSDYCIDMNQYEDGSKVLSKTLDAAAWLIPKFDIFHFHYGSTLTFDYSDLPLLNELGKKVLVQFWGDEVNKTPAASKVDSYSVYKDKEKLTSISKYVSLCIVPNEEIYESVKEFIKKIYIIKPNDIDKLIDLYKSLF
jgi:tetratricopeptide (TPR) repeat protein